MTMAASVVVDVGNKAAELRWGYSPTYLLRYSFSRVITGARFWARSFCHATSFCQSDISGSRGPISVGAQRLQRREIPHQRHHEYVTSFQADPFRHLSLRC